MWNRIGLRERGKKENLLSYPCEEKRGRKAGSVKKGGGGRGGMVFFFFGVVPKR